MPELQPLIPALERLVKAGTWTDCTLATRLESCSIQYDVVVIHTFLGGEDQEISFQNVLERSKVDF